MLIHDLENEKTKLDSLISKLTYFINENPEFETLSKEMKDTLKKQFEGMTLYLRCLESRLVLLKREV